MESQEFWLDNLRRYETLEELRGSLFFAECGNKIQRFLSTPQVFTFSGSVPRLHSFVRIVQWNIEKGKRFEEILHCLQSSDILKWADVILLNEADLGMNRTRNRNVARELAGELGMQAVFAPAHFELTKGVAEELSLEGDNRESLQGNAILSRYPILKTEVIPLPITFEPYSFHEKRFGRRNCLWAQLQLRESCLWVGTTHLELRNSPACRAAQMRHIMECLPGQDNAAYLLGGDLNTNGFARGTAWRTVKAALTLLFTQPSKMKYQLLHPECGREPVFDVLAQHGFMWEGFNSSEETARTEIGALEEADFLPDAILKAFQKRLDPYKGYLGFKLDWLLGKNIRGLGAGQKFENRENVSSLEPGCLFVENAGPNRVSDHLPLYADLDLA
jgi:endonuclease/exonuclease/phosphatase family metal-dependent hydrolase